VPADVAAVVQIVSVSALLGLHHYVFCPIFIEGQIVAKLESFANESRVLFTDE
jgi:hypothetical protein